MAGRNFPRLRLRLLRLWLELLLWPRLRLRLLLERRVEFPLGRPRSGTFLGLVLVVCHVAPLGPG